MPNEPTRQLIVTAPRVNGLPAEHRPNENREWCPLTVQHDRFEQSRLVVRPTVAGPQDGQRGVVLAGDLTLLTAVSTLC